MAAIKTPKLGSKSRNPRSTRNGNAAPKLTNQPQPLSLIPHVDLALVMFLKEAIEARQAVILDYDPGMRDIEPHALGKGSDGQYLLRAYQTNGVSASGEHSAWKLFRVDRIKSYKLDEYQFEYPREGYKMGDKAMSTGIIKELYSPQVQVSKA